MEAHNEFLKIEEYRDVISRDSPGLPKMFGYDLVQSDWAQMSRR
jgi:hypothetical protein